jgi:lipopolysaccharide biosynthesis glycosyltransferase
MSTWDQLIKSQNYQPLSGYHSARVLVVTATDDAYSQGAVGMIKSFLFNSKLTTSHLVLAKDLNDHNRKMITALPRTTVCDLNVHNAPDYWCTWILELFYLENLSCYDYVFYVDTDIMVRKELASFVDKFSEYDEDSVCAIDHKRSWHTKWFYRRKSHNFNAGFIIFKGSFFDSDIHHRIKASIRKNQPKNDEQYLRKFFGELLYAPTKFNARIIWIDDMAYKNDDVYVVHFVGQENKPWIIEPQGSLGHTARIGRPSPLHAYVKEWYEIFNKRV